MTYILEIIQYLLTGAGVSTLIFVVTLVLSFPLSVVLSILFRQNKILKKIISFYTYIFRGTPLMLQLFFFMYGLPAIGIRVDRISVALITFALNYAAYFTEILRAGIESLDKDQEESAAVLGASKWQTFRYVILPQAIRRQLPTITNEVITLIKDTSLVTVIAISDLMRQVKEIVARDFTVSPFVVAAIFYLLFSYVIVYVFRKIEEKNDFLDGQAIAS
ncbi:amino acid ABC transporter permease [Mycoplasmatota bacterium]|nr:amino acid ABC transporter permease [Mycoplasmatota bacterium]